MGPSSPHLQHLPLGGAHMPAWHLPGLPGPPVPAVRTVLWGVAVLMFAVSQRSGQCCRQSWADSSLETPRSGHPLHSPRPRLPPPYLGCPSWDPGVQSSWWMPRACSPAQEMPGTWSWSVGRRQNPGSGFKAGSPPGARVGPGPKQCLERRSRPTSWGFEGKMRGLGQPGLLGAGPLCPRQLWALRQPLPGLGKGREAAGTHVMRGGLGEALVGEVSLQPAGEAPAVSP